MKAEELRDLRVAILLQLYTRQPLGRRAVAIHRLARSEVDCTEQDVAAQLAFLQGEKYVEPIKADDLAPGLDPFWVITSSGMKYCEEKHLI